MDKIPSSTKSNVNACGGSRADIDRRTVAPSARRSDWRARFLSEEIGQSFLELAVLAPVLLILLIGVVEMGYGLYSYLLVMRASDEGARLAADGADDANATQTTVLTVRGLPITSTSGLSKLDVYVIRGQTNGSGTITTWNANHTWSSPNATTPVSAAALQSALVPGGAQAANMKIAVVQVFYRHQPLFGFNVGPFAQGIPMSSYSVVRDVGP